MTSYGRQDINECIEHLTKVIGAEPQGSAKMNRDKCAILLGRLGKMYPDRPAVESVKRLIDYGVRTPQYYNIKDFKWLLDNYLYLIDVIKIVFPPKKEKTITLPDGRVVKLNP